MKKLIATAAVLACAASIVSAQTVTSANIVGYNKDVSEVGFHISGMQFDNVTNNVSTVYGDQMPVGSKVYSFNGAGYDISSYGSVFVPFVGLVTKWSSDLDLANGAGYWLEAPVAASAVLSGEVPLDAAITNTLFTGFNLVSYPYPVERVVSNLGFAPVAGDKIYVFNGSNYDISSYGSVFVPFVGLVTKWSNETLPVAVGQGFWYESVSGGTWVAEKPFSE